ARPRGRRLAHRLRHQGRGQPRAQRRRGHEAREPGGVARGEGPEEAVRGRAQLAMPRRGDLAPRDREPAGGGEPRVVIMLGLARASRLPARIARLVADHQLAGLRAPVRDPEAVGPLGRARPRALDAAALVGRPQLPAKRTRALRLRGAGPEREHADHAIGARRPHLRLELPRVDRGARQRRLGTRARVEAERAGAVGAAQGVEAHRQGLAAARHRRAHHAEGHAAPRLHHRVEALADERGRRERPAPVEAVEHLRVHQLVELTHQPLPLRGVGGGGELLPREGAKPLQSVLRSRGRDESRHREPRRREARTEPWPAHAPSVQWARMTRILDRYIIKELGPPFAIGVGVFTFFLVIDRIYQLTDLVITKSVPFALVLPLLIYMLPAFLALTLPMATLVAVLLVCGRLASDLEVAALKASGVSPLRLFRPFLAAGIAITLLIAWLPLIVGPWSSGAYQRQLFRILQTRASTGIKERTFSPTFNQFVIYVDEVSPSQVRLKGLLVSDERNPEQSRIIVAREGRLLSDEANRRITLRFLDGSISESDVGDRRRFRQT